MNVKEKLEQIQRVLNEGREVVLDKNAFIELIQESKSILGSDSSIVACFWDGTSIYLSFNTNRGFVQVLRAYVPEN